MYMHVLNVPMAVPRSCSKNFGPNLNKLFLIMISITKKSESAGKSSGSWSQNLAMKSLRILRSWLALMLRYMATASIMNAIIPGGGLHKFCSMASGS